MEKVSVFIKIRVLFWTEISALGVFFNFDNERMRPPKYPSAPPRVLNRYLEYDRNRLTPVENRLQSPTFDMLRISEILNLYNEIGMMIHGTRVYSKKQWRDIVRERAWLLENQDWQFRVALFNTTKYINATIDYVQTLIWWQIGSFFHEIMLPCETMCKLVCRASDLKSDSHQYKDNPLNRPICNNCNEMAMENVEHLLMHCPYLNEEGDFLSIEIENLERYYGINIITQSFHTTR